MLGIRNQENNKFLSTLPINQCIVTPTPHSERESLEWYSKATKHKDKWVYSKKLRKTKPRCKYIHKYQLSKILPTLDQDSGTCHRHHHRHQNTPVHPPTAIGDREEEAVILGTEIGTPEDAETVANKTTEYLRQRHKPQAKGQKGSGS